MGEGGGCSVRCVLQKEEETLLCGECVCGWRMISRCSVVSVCEWVGEEYAVLGAEYMQAVSKEEAVLCGVREGGEGSVVW